MPNDKAPESAALRRIIVMAVALVLVAAGLGLVLRSVLGRGGGAKPGFSVPGLLGSAAEQAREQPPDLRETSEKLGEVTRENWGKAEFIQPREEEIDQATGEVMLPFHGFAVSVESAPAGARVIVDGREIGESPAIASVDCRPGAEVRVRVEKALLRPQERTIRCRVDKLLKLKVRLVR